MASSPPSAILFLAGLGPAPRRTATLEVLRALSGCGTIFCASGREAQALLRSFCPGVRLVSIAGRVENGRGRLYGNNFWAKRILKELHKGVDVGCVFPEHPLAFHPLASRLARDCSAADLPCRALGAISAVDVFLARSGMVLGSDLEGISALGLSELETARTLSVGHAVLIYFTGPFSLEHARRLGNSLARFYPPAQPCWVYALAPEAPPAKLLLADMTHNCPALAKAHFLYLPARKAAHSRRGSTAR